MRTIGRPDVTRSRRRFSRWLVGLALVPVVLAASALRAAELPTSLFVEEEIETLSGVNAEPQHIDAETHPELHEAAMALHGVDCRLSGTEGCDRAARYIKRRFEQIGMKVVVEQPFEVVVPVTKRCEIKLGDSPVAGYPLWPNWVRTASTPGPITCPVVYAADGRPSSLNGLPIEGAIVVVEHNTGARWQRIAQYAPRAFLFVEPETEETLRYHAEMKLLHDPVNIPRFWIPETRGSKPGHIRARELVRRVKAAQERYLAAAESGGDAAEPLLQATVDSHVVWETRKAKNVIGFLEGTEGTLEQGHFMAFSAHYDSTSIAPDVSPGADASSSMAALLRLADHLSRNRIREGVMFIAFAGHYQSLRGATWFADSMRLSNTLTKDGARYQTDALRREIERLSSKPVPWRGLLTAAEELGRLVGGLSGIDPDLRDDMMEEVQALVDGSAEFPAEEELAAGRQLAAAYGATLEQLTFDPQPHFDRLKKLLAGDPLNERIQELIESDINQERRLGRYDDLAQVVSKAEGLDEEIRREMLAEVEQLKRRLLSSTSSHSNYANLFDLLDEVDIEALSPATRRDVKFAIEREQDADRHIGMHRFELLRLQKHQAFLKKLGIDLHKRLRIFYSLELSTDGNRFGLFTDGAVVEQREGVNPETVYGDLLQQIWQMGRKRPPARATGQKADLYERIIYPLQQSERLKGQGNSFFVGALGYDSEMIQRVGREAVAFVTVDAGRRRVDTPTDTFAAIQRHDGIERLTYQTELLSELITAMDKNSQIRAQYKTMDNKRTSDDSPLVDYGVRVYGRVVLYDLRRSVATADVPQPHALCVTRFFPRAGIDSSAVGGPHSFAGVRAGWKTIADEGGRFELLGVPHDNTRAWARHGFRFEAFRFYNPDRPEADREELDEEGHQYKRGAITHAPDLGPQGDVMFPIEQKPSKEFNEVTVPIFKCRAAAVLGFFNPLQAKTFTDIIIWDAKTNTIPDFYGLSRHPRGGVVRRGVPTAVVYVKHGTRFKLMFKTGALGSRLPLLRVRQDRLAVDGEARGAGYDVPEYGILPNSRMLMTRDVVYLDEYRINALAEHAVENNRVNELHRGKRDEAGEVVRRGALAAFEEADEAIRAHEYDRFLTQIETALAKEGRAYPIVKQTTTDILTGVLFYLFLLLPFSFFVERLLFGFPSVNKRIAGFFGIFMVVFLVLALVHPAFAITQSAPVILIAFISLALSLLVIAMIRGRFELEVRRLHERPGSRQSADFKRMSATGAACALGIGNMRRRRTRTLLTLITLVLLTFSVLSFTSVNPRQITHENPNPTGERFEPPYPGVLLRDYRYQPISDYLYELVRAEFGDRAEIVPRAWLGSDALLQSTDTDEFHREFLSPAVMGMRPNEPTLAGVQDYLKAGRWLREDDPEPVCILGGNVAENLEIDKDRITGKLNEKTPRVRIFGQEIPVVGLLNDDKFARLKGIDGEQISTVDWRQESWMKRSGKEFDPYTVERYQHVDPENCIVLPFEFVRDYGSGVISVAIVPREYRTYLKYERLAREAAEAKSDEADLTARKDEARTAANDTATAIGDELLSRLTLPIYISAQGRVTYKLSSDANRVAGFGAMIVPMLICAMIVLNTMLGSVYERQREIGIFGSLGLAPVHIGSLFVAEAAVFATVAVILGYVLGQTTSFFIAHFGLLEGFSLNYSSTSAVISAVAVMALVLLSTIYPARKASQLSVPDVERIWKLPEPDGDDFHIKFPFTIGGEQAYGVNMFLLEYFRDHANQSVGDFFAQDSELSLEKTEGNDTMRFESQVWIAPFDFGISQSVVLRTLPTDEEGIFAPEMHIHRKSGSPASWARMNHKFLKLVRQQFLMWRILSTDERHLFAAQAKVHLGIATDEDRRIVEEAMRARAPEEEEEEEKAGAGVAAGAGTDESKTRGEEK
ncbi:MAG: FtsX-like permease family protein [Planctomycetota bacterium]